MKSTIPSTSSKQFNPPRDQSNNLPGPTARSHSCWLTFRLLCGVLCVFAFQGFAVSQSTIEQWGIFEFSLKGPTNGNPFLDTPFSAQFTFDYADSSATEITGFYDGDGTYRVRFMPSSAGPCHYVTRSRIPELDRKSGQFTVTKPSAKNHGPVHVTNTFHFAYADGKPFKQLGTTCYAWIHQDPSLEEQTLKTLASSPFDKIRFCIFPKHYDWNTNEPLLYPFAGTPPRDWDFSRFNPKFFHHLEKRIADLRELGIEADLILFHPYDEGHWGFDRMTSAQDDRYLRYVISRLAAYRNVWWSLANEYDFMKEKREEDFERFGQIVSTSDPYHHLLSIHNGKQLFNHTRPWITHASIQNGSAVEDSARAVLYRDAYRKPIVFDEVKYEGNIPKRWGNISAEELVFRFWQGTIAGTYVGHGETYLHPSDILWWSKGGVLRGQSPPRLAFLRQVLEDSPAEGVEPIDKWQNSEYGGQPGKYYLVYFGKSQPASWEFKLPKPPQGKNALEDGLKFKAEVLDTWNMTVSALPGFFTLKRKTDYFYGDINDRKIELPGQPFIALRITRIDK
jgi:Domain of unknown function (DUF5605)/Domain of unknown function (DUF5060)/Protein of unknown function (DUF4038)